MISSELMVAINDDLHNKEFYYKSKYGGITKGLVKQFFSITITCFEDYDADNPIKTSKGDIPRPKGECFHRQKYKITSTNGITYDYDEIYFKGVLV